MKDKTYSIIGWVVLAFSTVAAYYIMEHMGLWNWYATGLGIK